MAYTPASVILQGNTNLQHNYTGGSASGLYIFHYQTKALDTLQKKFVFMDVLKLDDMPKQSGNTVQWYRYRELGTNTTAVGSAAEGAVGTAIPALNSDIITATLSQYMDFVTLSDRVILTSIDGMVQSATERMSYRAAYTVDTITRAEIDSISAADRSSALLGTYLSSGDIRLSHAYLQGNDVRPMQSGSCAGYFCGIIHPYIVFDVVNDPAANGIVDVRKYTEGNPFEKVEDRGQAFTFNGIMFKVSTNVLVASSNYRTYIFGDGGIGGSQLAGKGPSKVSDPRNQRFRLHVEGNLAPSLANPTGSIGGFVSYNFCYVAKVLTDTLTGGSTFNRFIYYDTPTQVS
jgi:N4-gp56 family major capsid protein